MRAAGAAAVALVAVICVRPLAAQTPAPQERPRQRAVRIATAQFDVVRDRPGAHDATATVYAIYPAADGDLLDHADYLEDLDARFAGRGLAVTVVLPPAAAEAFAAAGGRLTIASSRLAIPPSAPRVVLVSASSDAPIELSGVDGLADVLEAETSGAVDAARTAETLRRLELLAQAVVDGGTLERAVAEAVARAPRSGLARAAEVLAAWWCRGEPATARDAVERGLTALAGESAPTARFADLVLRGDRFDPVVAGKLADAMQTAAAASPRGPTTQLIYLRALLRAGRDRDAGRLAATLPRRLADRPALQVVFAETLMEATQPLVYRDLAARALTRAEASGADQRWLYAARHKLFVRCGEPASAAALMKDYRQRGVSQNSLNNDAWYAMTRLDTMGRFDTLALAQCDEIQRLEGGALDFVSVDTVALAMFVNGRVARAVELQTGAVKAFPNDAAYEARLLRYRATAARLEAPR